MAMTDTEKLARQIVRLRKKGLGEAAIAAKVDKSRSTVRHHLSQHEKGLAAKSKRGKVYRRYGDRAREWHRQKEAVRKLNKTKPAGEKRHYVSERWSSRENRWKTTTYRK